MNKHTQIKQLADKLRFFIFGQVSPSYNKIITDVFVAPNVWRLAKSVHWRRIHNSRFRYFPTDNLTLVVSFNDHTLEAVKDVLMQDYNHLPKGKEFLELVRNLPDMIGDARERQRETLQSIFKKPGSLSSSSLFLQKLKTGFRKLRLGSSDMK